MKIDKITTLKYKSIEKISRVWYFSTNSNFSRLSKSSDEIFIFNPSTKWGKKKKNRTTSQKTSARNFTLPV
jgi:hypothetical protein